MTPESLKGKSKYLWDRDNDSHKVFLFEDIKSAVKGCLKELDDCENPFVGERFFGHENCYNEFERLRNGSINLIKKWFEDVM